MLYPDNNNSQSKSAIQNHIKNLLHKHPNLYRYDDTTGYSIPFGETIGDCADVGLLSLELRKQGVVCNVVQMYKSQGNRLDNPNHALLLIKVEEGLCVFDPTLYVYDVVLLPNTINDPPTEYLHKDMQKTIGMSTSYKKVDPSQFELDETISIFEWKQKDFHGNEKYDYFTTQPIDITTLKQNIAMNNRPGGKLVIHTAQTAGELLQTFHLKRTSTGDIGYYDKYGNFKKGSLLKGVDEIDPCLLSIHNHTNETLYRAFDNRTKQQNIVKHDFTQDLHNQGLGIYVLQKQDNKNETGSSILIGYIPATNVGSIQGFLGKHLLWYSKEKNITISGLNIIEESSNGSINEESIKEYYNAYIAYLQNNPHDILILESDSYAILCNIMEHNNLPLSTITKKCIIVNPLGDPRTYINRIHRNQFPNYTYHYGHNKYVYIEKSNLFMSNITYKPNIPIETLTTPPSLRKTLYGSINEGPIPILSSHHLIEQLPQTIDTLLSHYLNSMSSSLLTLEHNQYIEYVYEKPHNRNGMTCLYVHGFKSGGTSGTKASQTKYAMTDNGIAFLGWNFRGNNVDHNDTLPYESMNFQTMADDMIAMIQYAIEHGATKHSIIIVPSSLGASATIQAIIKKSDLEQYIKHIYFLAPCINFGEYKTTQAIATGELTQDELEQRKIQGRKEELHFRKNTPVHVGRNLIQNGLDEQQHMIDVVHHRSIPTTIFHGDQDDQIYAENGRTLAGDKHTYNEVKGADHQFSAHYNDILVSILQEQVPSSSSEIKDKI